MKTLMPSFRWFAWHPVKTEDRGWRWLRFVSRRRVFYDQGQHWGSFWAHSVEGK